jgi:hypothetical protein
MAHWIQKAILWCNRSAIARSLAGVLVSLMLLGVGITGAWLVKNWLGTHGEVAFVAVLLTPVLIYFVATGQLASLKGPADLELRFAQVAKSNVRAASEALTVSSDQMLLVAKGNQGELRRLRAELPDDRPIVMTMVLGAQGRYVRQDVMRYLSVLLTYRNFKFIALAAEDGTFVGYMSPWALKNLMEAENLGEEFLEAINAARRQRLIEYPGVITRTVSTQATNARALREMMERRLEALIVLDEAQRIAGVVERDQLMAVCLLSAID